MQARPSQQTALTSEPGPHGAAPPQPSLPAHPGGPGLCYYCQGAAQAAAKTPQRLHRKTQMSASVCLQLRDLRPALELAMDVRCKEGWCPALGKNCQAPYGPRATTMWVAQQIRPGLSPAQVPAGVPGEATGPLCPRRAPQSPWLKTPVGGPEAPLETCFLSRQPVCA